MKNKTERWVREMKDKKQIIITLDADNNIQIEERGGFQISQLLYAAKWIELQAMNEMKKQAGAMTNEIQF
jgi:hypothetical protein